MILNPKVGGIYIRGDYPCEDKKFAIVRIEKRTHGKVKIAIYHTVEKIYEWKPYPSGKYPNPKYFNQPWIPPGKEWYRIINLKLEEVPIELLLEL
jgi:hypothetical protein